MVDLNRNEASARDSFPIVSLTELPKSESKLLPIFMKLGKNVQYNCKVRNGHMYARGYLSKTRFKSYIGHGCKYYFEVSSSAIWNISILPRYSYFVIYTRTHVHTTLYV